ncbi:TonB-dependent receptor domain-containing protein [Sphingobium sp. HWE2-09]|uniref:TonB-dependent receptor domain-containing protein n=1 Tax=Sphingobium sp. HWE2-09 TaxID=3108390 RepID=UPI002DCFBCC2|nr:TonB-dependent receptor [Sphingobium sp. HWE2-09]
MRDGSAAPTPVTVISQAALVRSAPTSIPDALNQLPQLQNSRSPTQDSGVNSDRPNTGNYLNLRSLGSPRTLILLNGTRVPPTSFAGDVDSSIFPQLLIERVDLVTGGASAAYGSDAVSGVVNFVLDTKFSGLKGVIQRGISSRGDSPSFRAGAAAGSSFLDGRLHLTGSIEHYENDGIDLLQDRPFGDLQAAITGAGTATNPFTASFNTRYTRTNFTGLITSGPLNNNQFLENGVLAPYNPGSPTGSANVSTGGDGAYTRDKTLSSAIKTDQFYGRVSFEPTDGLNLFGQVLYGRAHNRQSPQPDYRFGNVPPLRMTIFPDNAFLRPEVSAATGGQPFFFGRLNDDFPRKFTDVETSSLLTQLGVEGKIGDFNWDASYVHGSSKLKSQVSGQSINQRFYAAVDAVRDPATNQAVCRVTLVNPGLLPGCVPINLFGPNAASPESIAYVLGTSTYRATTKMDIGSVNISGQPFSLWAGPVGFAIGGEIRRQTLDLTSNSDPSDVIDYTGIRGVFGTPLRFLTDNVGSASGDYTVKEVYGEVDIPLLKNSALGKSLSVNGAARYTHYSTSGGVVTWKLGLNYEPFDGLRIRTTRSRDIRAPSLYELYAGTTNSDLTVFDPHTSASVLVNQESGGNKDLRPEVANTLTIGAVYQPTWAPRLAVSIDYYRVDIKDGIGTLDSSTVLQECEAAGGTGPLCDQITRPLPFSDKTLANLPTNIRLPAVNVASQFTDGFDIETSYVLPLGANSLSFRLLANYLMSFKTQTSPSAMNIDDAGTVFLTTALPRLRGVLSATYASGPFSLTYQQRYIGKLKRVTANRNAVWDPKWQYLKPYFISDVTLSYNIKARAHDFEWFLSVNNVFDKFRLVPPDNTNPGILYPTARSVYDVVGRYFTTGVRMKL